MVDMKVGGRRMLAESYHPKRDHMNTSQTIGVLLAAGAILLPSCETERVNERPIGHLSYGKCLSVRLRAPWAPRQQPVE